MKKSYSLPPDAILTARANELLSSTKDGWQAGLFSALNGNASIALPGPFEDFILITASKTHKGRLKKEDISLILKDGETLSGKTVSSETKVHLALYKALSCGCVLHTHPTYLLAYGIRRPVSTLFSLPLYEARLWNYPFSEVDAIPPGTSELANAVFVEASRFSSDQGPTGCIWLAEHGLCVFADTMTNALAASEELEHLAHIALLTS